MKLRLAKRHIYIYYVLLIVHSGTEMINVMVKYGFFATVNS